MEIFISFCIIAFGMVIGSFLNVVIYRLPLDQSVVKPGSFCPECKNPVKWYQNVPLFSYLFLRGKCGHCKAPIPWRYPLVEFLTAVLFWTSWKGGYGWDLHVIISQLRIWVFIAICIAVTFIDLDLASIGGFGFFFLFALLYEKLTGRVGLGGGDIKFMGTIGVFLGAGGIWASLLLSSIIGSMIGLSLAKFQKKATSSEGGEGARTPVLRMSLPYGPFLVFGALIELYFEVSQWIGL